MALFDPGGVFHLRRVDAYSSTVIHPPTESIASFEHNALEKNDEDSQIALSAVLTLPVMTSLAHLAQSGAILATGTFHGAVHKTSGRATVYQATRENVLRLTHFSTSNGPNVHVLLIAAADAKDDENFLTEKVDRIDLGPLKGNEGDQNSVLPAGIDLAKYKDQPSHAGHLPG